MIQRIKPVGKLHARMRLPGSKSITHRALLMAALADGESTILNPLRAEEHPADRRGTGTDRGAVGLGRGFFARRRPPGKME